MRGQAFVRLERALEAGLKAQGDADRVAVLIVDVLVLIVLTVPDEGLYLRSPFEGEGRSRPGPLMPGAEQSLP